MELYVIAIDIAKQVFPLHWVDIDTGSIEPRKLRRSLKDQKLHKLLKRSNLLEPGCSGTRQIRLCWQAAWTADL
jgi:hypothetical protein